MPTLPPLVEFDPTGKAPILSYNIPEPTTYSGKNFIELQIPQDWFAAPTRLPLTAKPDNSAAINAGSGARPLGTTQPATIATSSSAAKAGNAEITSVPKITTQATTKMLYRSMSGAISTRSYSLMKETDGGVDKPTKEVPDHTPQLTINTPSAGFSVSQAGTSATFSVTGRVLHPKNGAGVVRVQVGSSAPITANQLSSSTTQVIYWNATVSAPPGPVTLKIEYLAAGNVLDEATVSGIVTLLPPQSGAPDTTMPMLTILEPSFGASVEAVTVPVTIRIRGNANDTGTSASGVKIVETSMNGKVFATAQQVQGSWAEWHAMIDLPDYGTQELTVCVQDNAGNRLTQLLRLKVIKKAPRRKVARLLLVESLRLSTFPSDYGAGRTVSTFSLLPGEKVRLALKTYQKTVTSANDTTSIFDSFTQESADDFESGIENEQAHKENYDESFKYSVSGEAQAQWGWGSAKISANVSGSSNSAREEAGRNIMRTASKHAAKASAKRDIQVTRTVQTSTETTQESEFIREFENINRSRTLNFVFRQLNQQYVSLLHLIDVRIGFYELLEGEDTGVYIETALPQLDSFLSKILVMDQIKIDQVRESILHQLRQIFDYSGEMRNVLLEDSRKDAAGALIPGTEYLRFDRKLTSDYTNPVTNLIEHRVPGVIIDADNFVLRTSALIVDSLLGQGDGLDGYAKLLQAETARQRKLENDKLEHANAADSLREKIVVDNDTSRAELYEKLYEAPVPPASK